MNLREEGRLAGRLVYQKAEPPAQMKCTPRLSHSGEIVLGRCRGLPNLTTEQTLMTDVSFEHGWFPTRR